MHDHTDMYSPCTTGLHPLTLISMLTCSLYSLFPAALHAMAYINTLLNGTSTLHIKPDGTRSNDPKLREAVKEQVRGQ